MNTLNTLSDAIEFFEDTMAAQPDRDALTAQAASWAGMARRYPTIRLEHRVDPADQSTSASIFEAPPTEFSDDEQGMLASRIVRSLAPLDLCNPVWKAVNLAGATSPADLIPSFGIPKSEDGGAPAYTMSIEELLKLPPPDPETAGLMPTFKKSAAMIRELTPSSFKINMPDMQGPYNLLHALVGDEAFTAPYTDPEQFYALMERITDFWISAGILLGEWIGKDRLSPADSVARIAECSVNMVSADFYKEHILPFDLRIAKHFGSVRIHPCSGSHVFQATLEALPVTGTEAGMMLMPMAAPVISVRKALEFIGDRPIALSVGQELPEDREEAFKIVAGDMDLALENPRMLIGYTGIHWRKKDRPMIRELHFELDRYWAAKFDARTPSEKRNQLWSIDVPQVFGVRWTDSAFTR